jgi:hypothetical protein
MSNSYNITPVTLRNTEDFGYKQPGGQSRITLRPNLAPLLPQNAGAIDTGDAIPALQTRQHPPEHKEEFNNGRASGRAEDDALPGDAAESAEPEITEAAEALM